MKAGCIMCYPVEINEETFSMMIEIDSHFWMRSAKWLTIKGDVLKAIPEK
jgi:hypothetical protein